ncbi:MAG: DedA family protein [Thiotrichaceae bacterium]|nr:DedA family protein [Thiotrichaceae bacterium]
MEEFIQNYGYLAIFIGTFFEGETILVVGGILAQQGLLELPLVALAAFVGSFSGDQLFFQIGRIKGKALLDKRPSWKARAEKINDLLERYRDWIVLSFRFFYGLRNPTPFVIGMSSISTIRFMTLNGIGALVWAFTISTLGYVFGNAMEAFMEDMKHYMIYVIIGIFTVAGIVWWYVNRKQAVVSPSTPPKEK